MDVVSGQATASPLAALLAIFHLAQEWYRRRDYELSYKLLHHALRVTITSAVITIENYSSNVKKSNPYDITNEPQ